MKLFKTVSALSIALVLVSCSSKEPNSKDENPENSTLKYDFLWDFSEIEDIAYSYEMTSIETESFARDEAPYSIKTTVIGDMIVGSHGDRTATVSISNAEKTMFSLTDDNEWSPAKPQPINKLTVGELKQYSRFENSRIDAIWDAFLPLPLEEIKQGQSYKLKMSIPVSMEDNKYVNGTNEITFKGYKTVKGRKCAILEGNIDVSDIDKLEFEGEYSHFLKGKGTYYFDTKDHIYVRADVEIVMERKVDSGEKEDVKEDLFMYSQIKETFSIQLK